MQIVIDIDERIIQQAKHYNDLPYDDYVKMAAEAIANGILLPKVMADLQTELFMSVDGGTDDKYVRTCDVIDRIEKTVQEFMETLDEEGSDK